MQVCRRGEELQKKLCSTDGTRPAVNLEQEEGVLQEAFALFHGSAVGVALNALLPESQRTQPASPAGMILTYQYTNIWGGGESCVCACKELGSMGRLCVREVRVVCALRPTM